MTWAAYRVAVVNILVGRAGSCEVSATMEHKLDFPLVDEPLDEMENEEQSGAVIFVILKVVFSCGS